MHQLRYNDCMMSDKEMNMTAAEFVDYLRAEGKDYAYITGVFVSLTEQIAKSGESMEYQMKAFRRYREQLKARYPDAEVYFSGMTAR